MDTSNRIGALGEHLFNYIISRNYKFQPVQLGEKYPNVDFFVELLGCDKPYYFLVQTKATEKGINRNGKLRISIPKGKIKALAKYSCPTYLVGIDIPGEQAFIYPVNKMPRKAISSFSTAKPLTAAILDNLFDDVIAFWGNTDIKKNKHKHIL